MAESILLAPLDSPWPPEQSSGRETADDVGPREDPNGTKVFQVYLLSIFFARNI